MVRLVLFFSFLLSIPLVLVSAFLFKDAGQFILLIWFLCVFFLIGVGGFIRFIEDQKIFYGKTEGVYVQAKSHKSYERHSGNYRRYETYMTPQIEYFWQGKRYLTGDIVSYNYLAYKLFCPKEGSNIRMLVPINDPENAIKDKFLAKYIHLIIGTISISLSIALFLILKSLID